MKTARTGIIIFTGQFIVLKEFYEQVFNFPVHFDAQWEEEPAGMLICYDTGSGYLLLETPQGQDLIQSPTPTLRIRLHLDDVPAFGKHLESLNIEHSYMKNPWGETIEFKDPDGNFIHIRDEAMFLQ